MFVRAPPDSAFATAAARTPTAMALLMGTQKAISSASSEVPSSP